MGEGRHWTGVIEVPDGPVFLTQHQVVIRTVDRGRPTTVEALVGDFGINKRLKFRLTVSVSI